MNANLAERSSVGLIADSPTDELCQVEPGASAADSREPAELHNARENRGVLDGLKVIGLA